MEIYQEVVYPRVPTTSRMTKFRNVFNIYLSLARKFKIKSPTLSAPTAVRRAVLSPNRLQPTAILSGDPPTKASKPFIFTKSAPIFNKDQSKTFPLLLRPSQFLLFPLFFAS